MNNFVLKYIQNSVKPQVIPVVFKQVPEEGVHKYMSALLKTSQSTLIAVHEVGDVWPVDAAHIDKGVFDWSVSDLAAIDVTEDRFIDVGLSKGLLSQKDDSFDVKQRFLIVVI